MKILVITQMFPCIRHPTSGIFFANLIKELSSKVDELIVVTPRIYIPRFLSRFRKGWDKWYLDPMKSKENGFEIFRPFVLYLPSTSFVGINGILMQYSLLNFLKKLIKERKIEIMLGYNMLPEGIAAVRLARKFELPVGFWAIGSDINDFARYNRINYYLSKKCIEKSHLILTESKDLENNIRTFSKKNVQMKTFYKGIDSSNFLNLPDKNVLKKELNLCLEKKYLLFIGRLIYDKGIYEIVESFRRIANIYPNHDLIMIGEEIEKEKLTVKFKEAGILNRVNFTGIIPYNEIAYFMKASELLVFPSWAEGLPNVVMEAMAAGLPVVSSDAGGIPEVLINGVTGLSVPVKNVEKLTEAIIKMIKDTELRETCIHNARELILEKFDVKKNVLQLFELLTQMKSEPAILQK